MEISICKHIIIKMKMLKHAFLIVAHAYPEQFKDIVRLLNVPGHHFFVTIDKKSRIDDFRTDLPNCHFLENNGGGENGRRLCWLHSGRMYFAPLA